MSNMVLTFVQTIAGLTDAQFKREDTNGGVTFEILSATYDNVITLNKKSDEASKKLDVLNEEVAKANAKLDILDDKVDEANKKLDSLLCPFQNNEPFVVLGQGCDGVDQDCNQFVDECEEDKVPPTIVLIHSPPKNPFQSVSLVETFLKDNIQVSDDCAANIDVLIELASERDCTDCKFTVTATDIRCVGNANAVGAVAVRSFSFNVDSIPPEITCGFSFPQDPFHTIDAFDPCLGLAPPFPPIDDFLHIDQNCFNKDMIDVQFWYQIKVRKLHMLMVHSINVVYFFMYAVLINANHNT